MLRKMDSQRAVKIRQGGEEFYVLSKHIRMKMIDSALVYYSKKAMALRTAHLSNDAFRKWAQKVLGKAFSV